MFTSQKIAYLLYAGCLTVLNLAFAQDPVLFQYQGKGFTVADVSSARQQDFYEADRLRYENNQQIIDYALLELFLQEQSEKQKKPKDVIEKELLKPAPVEEAALKAWFDANKDRLGGRTYESLKDEIKHVIERESQNKVREALIQKIKAEGKFVLHLSAPEAPVFSIQSEGYPAQGKLQGASVHLVEFADYQCPHCKLAHDALVQIMESYKDTVKFTFLDFPINHSGISRAVAEGAVCAHEQGKYWPYHDEAFKSQAHLTAESPLALAKTVKLDLEAFKKCLSGKKPSAVVALAKTEGERIGVQSTPTIFINGQRLPNYQFKTIKDAIDQRLGKSP